jgi:hypothetical protein
MDISENTILVDSFLESVYRQIKRQKSFSLQGIAGNSIKLADANGCSVGNLVFNAREKETLEIEYCWECETYKDEFENYEENLKTELLKSAEPENYSLINSLKITPSPRI